MANKAVFLDRDGVLLHEHGEYTFREEDVVILPNLSAPLLRLQDAGFLLIIITNQGGIGKGLYTHERLAEINAGLTDCLKGKGVLITALYYCPHHPISSHCICRKPDSLMLEKAIAKYNIDATQSYFIGDTERDMEAGIKAGVTTIKVEANANLNVTVNQILS
ncbi:MAG: HAD family hydrolase [Bacteroidetes bacterium]|nr:HAD family hydrolase [Bacteroidota bacterium]